MDDAEHRKWRAGAKKLAATIVHDDAAVGQNENLFIQALQCGPDLRRKHNTNPPNTSKDLRRSHFDDLADLWETKYAARGSLRQRTTSFVRCLRALVGARGQVLDFGCGSGDIAIACGNAGYRMSGVDLSPAMIARARLRANGDGIGFDALESEEPLRLPHPEARFDAVIASSVLEYVRDPLGCLQELSRVCRPNGVLLATVPNLCHPLRWLEVVLRHRLIRRGFGGTNRWQRYGEYLDISGNRFRSGHWSDLLRRAGWQLEAVRARSKPLVMLVARRAGLGEVHGGIDSPLCAKRVLEAQE
jgi:SAM-dependent methyltransferase